MEYFMKTVDFGKLCGNTFEDIFTMFRYLDSLVFIRHFSRVKVEADIILGFQCVKMLHVSDHTFTSYVFEYNLLVVKFQSLKLEYFD